MDIDIILDARAPAHDLAELGRLAEDNGIRGIWVSSLLDSRDPFTNLSVLAQSTSRVLLGPVAVNPWEIHPVRIASAFLTLNELANGRARIVIGGGGEALEALGIKPERRVRVVGECVEIMQAAASREPVDFTGEIFEVRNLQLSWPEAPRPPIFVGAGMPQMLRMAARVADGIMMSDVPAPLAANAIGELEVGAEFQTNMFAAWHVYTDRAAALAEAKRWLVLRGIFRPWLLETFLDGDEVAQVMNNAESFWAAFRGGSDRVDGVDEAVLNALVENLTFIADAADMSPVINKLREMSAAGLDAISLRLYANPAESIRLIGREILPALRE